MNTSKLIQLLEEAKGTIKQQVEIPLWAFGSGYERSLQRFVTSANDNEILEFLDGEHELAIFDRKSFNYGDTWVQVTLDELRNWLLFNTTKYGAEETAKKLNKYLELDHNPALQVLAITGIKIDQPLKLDQTVTLIPFSLLPVSIFKDNLDPPILKIGNLINNGLYHLSTSHILQNAHKPPTAALIRNIQLKPRTINKFEEKETIERLVLYEACEFLTLINNCAPIDVSFSYIVEEWVPCSNIGYGCTGTSTDIVSVEICEFPNDDREKVKDLYFKFKSLEQNTRDKLRIPIQRLNQARRRRLPVDKAIDLGIAFEALYLSGSGTKEQLSFTFRLRAAWHLGDTQESRKKLMNQFKEIYNLRSNAIHKGKVNQIVKIEGEKIDVNDFLKIADKLCMLSITKIIENGFPNWNSLVLGQ